MFAQIFPVLFYAGRIGEATYLLIPSRSQLLGEEVHGPPGFFHIVCTAEPFYTQEPRTFSLGSFSLTLKFPPLLSMLRVLVEVTAGSAPPSSSRDNLGSPTSQPSPNGEQLYPFLHFMQSSDSPPFFPPSSRFDPPKSFAPTF